MTRAEGGCLCERVRYAVQADPIRVTICHCRFCQKATGSAYMVEPIFEKATFALIAGEPRVYEHVSEGSGKTVFVHFCPDCGTKLYLLFERFPEAIGVYAGTFDDPDWFDLSAVNTKHIFLGVAQRGTIVPAHVNTFVEHATTSEGVPQQPTVFDEPLVIGSQV